MDKSVYESVFGRAWRDTEQFRRSMPFWAFQLVGGAVFAVISRLLIPSDAEKWIQVGVPSGGFVLGLILVYFCLFLLNLFLAPYRQKNDARNKNASLEAQIAELKKGRPAIKVTPVNGVLGDMYLEVTNEGERGDFEAQIELLEGREDIHGLVRPPLPIYRGYWQLGAGPKASLLQGQSDRLMVGTADMGRPGWTLSLNMTFYEPLSQRRAEYGTISWVPGSSGTKPARFGLHVTISSHPSTLNGPFARTYIVDGGDGDEMLREMPDAGHLGVNGTEPPNEQP